jgi:hypothetical protein
MVAGNGDQPVVNNHYQDYEDEGDDDYEEDETDGDEESEPQVASP